MSQRFQHLRSVLFPNTLRKEKKTTAAQKMTHIMEIMILSWHLRPPGGSVKPRLTCHLLPTKGTTTTGALRFAGM